MYQSYCNHEPEHIFVSANIVVTYCHHSSLFTSNPAKFTISIIHLFSSNIIRRPHVNPPKSRVLSFTVGATVDDLTLQSSPLKPQSILVVVMIKTE